MSSALTSPLPLCTILRLQGRSAPLDLCVPQQGTVAGPHTHMHPNTSHTKTLYTHAHICSVSPHKRLTKNTKSVAISKHLKEEEKKKEKKETRTDLILKQKCAKTYVISKKRSREKEKIIHLKSSRQRSAFSPIRVSRSLHFVECTNTALFGWNLVVCSMSIPRPLTQ